MSVWPFDLRSSSGLQDSAGSLIAIKPWDKWSVFSHRPPPLSRLRSVSAMARTTFFQATAALSLLASAVLARTVEYNFNVANGAVAPDGVTRNAVLGKPSSL